jgi:hypothetical protein
MGPSHRAGRARYGEKYSNLLWLLQFFHNLLDDQNVVNTIAIEHFDTFHL